MKFGLRRYDLAATFGWQDVAQSYRRSRVGAFWLTINMGVLIGALGLIFGTLFRAPMDVFLPYLCVGLIVWGFISSCINDGCSVFTNSGGIILQVKMPMFTHVMRVIWRNFITFLHNLIIYPLVFLVFGKVPTLTSFLAVFGLVIVVLNVAWIMLILATVCARFRDLTQIVQNIMQVAFYATPLMWFPTTLPTDVGHWLLTLNPFYHLVLIVRSPLLGEAPSLASWVVGLLLILVGWVVAIAFFGRFHRRIAYWL
ncbi:ABC transporter permease [Aurantimonas manganoxydans]|uniref:ABC transporter permease n=1 Tax=Aurantimonas manganoxydans TaxID=651183 RepID=UPI0011D18AE9|nr:ABC transporter permease [Aurantimonas manganoxydans]